MILKIVLEIANATGYDDTGRVKVEQGVYVKKSNILSLLKISMTVGNSLVGEQEYIDLLTEVKVDLILIINKKLKHQLKEKNRSS